MIILSLPRLGGERSFVICAVYTQVSRISHGTDKRIIRNTRMEEGPSGPLLFSRSTYSF